MSRQASPKTLPTGERSAMICRYQKRYLLGGQHAGMRILSDMSSTPDLRTDLESIQARLRAAAGNGDGASRAGDELASYAGEISNLGARVADALVAEFESLVDTSEPSAA